MTGKKKITMEIKKMSYLISKETKENIIVAVFVAIPVLWMIISIYLRSER